MYFGALSVLTLAKPKIICLLILEQSIFHLVCSVAVAEEKSNRRELTCQADFGALILDFPRFPFFLVCFEIIKRI